MDDNMNVASLQTLCLLIVCQNLYVINMVSSQHFPARYFYILQPQIYSQITNTSTHHHSSAIHYLSIQRVIRSRLYHSTKTHYNKNGGRDQIQLPNLPPRLPRSPPLSVVHRPRRGDDGHMRPSEGSTQQGRIAVGAVPFELEERSGAIRDIAGWRGFVRSQSRLR